MVSKPAIYGVAGGAVGVAVGFLANKVLGAPQPIPPDVQALVNTLRFHDVQRNVDLNRKVVLSSGTENSWQVWNIGYGINGYVGNDIILDLGANSQTGEVSASIAKLAWNAIEVYQGDNFKGTIPQYSDPSTVEPGHLGVMLRSPTM